MCADFLHIVDWHVCDRSVRPSQIIDKFVTSDGINPRRKRLVRIVCMPTHMNREQGLLNEVLDIGRASSRLCQSGLVISAQVPAQTAKNVAVCAFVASEGCGHEAFQFTLDGVHSAC